MRKHPRVRVCLAEVGGRVEVAEVSPGGHAAQAGVSPGDLLLATTARNRTDKVRPA